MNNLKQIPVAPISQSANKDSINIAVIISIWLVMVILVNPIGDFPLNDDWAFGRSVQYLVEKGSFHYPAWAAMNLFSQVLWGALFCIPFGFSFTALRFSSLTLGLIGVIGTYGLFRELNLNHKISLLGALLVVVNPVYFSLSNTFMTDIPFFAFAILSLLFFIRGLKRDSNIEILIGTIIACIAILNRQTGIAIPLAFGITYLFKKGLNIKSILISLYPIIIGFMVNSAYGKWLKLTNQLPASYGMQVNMLRDTFASSIQNILYIYNKNILTSLIYLGLFTFPFLIVYFFSQFQKLSSIKKLINIFCLSILFIVIIQILIVHRQKIGLVGTTLIKWGIGPLTLRDGLILNNINILTPTALNIFWYVMTLIGVVGGVLLIQYLFLATIQIFRKQNFKGLSQNWQNVIILALSLIYFLPIAGIKVIYDRYLLFLLPLLIILVSASTINFTQGKFGSRAFSICLTMLVLYGVFTVGATRDYLLWNRVRWQALNNLTASQISPQQIDGGFEFNGWYLYNPQYQESPDKSYWWVEKDNYTIAFGPMAGYREVKRYPLKRVLPIGPENIFVLQKNTIA